MECGVFGGGAAANDGHWAIGAGTPTFSTTTVNNGARALRCNPSAATQYAYSIFNAAAQTRLVGRCYLRFATLPGASCDLISFGPSPFSGPLVTYNSPDTKIYAAVGGTKGASGVTVTTGVWYRIDFDFNIATGGNDTCDVRVDGTACGQATATGWSAGQTEIDLGALSSATCDLFLDDVILSLTGADYPIGAGKVLAYVPDADGTHNVGTDMDRGTTAAPTGDTSISGSTTDAYQWVNGTPLLGGASNNTRLINMTALSSTHYAEVDFQATAETAAPRAVEVITADRQDGTGSGSFQTKLNDNGTEDAIANYGSVAGVTTDRYVTKQYATMVGGGAWTLARFNALKARFGYSTDANPDQFWRGIMIEAEFAVVTKAPPPFQRRWRYQHRTRLA